MGPSLFAWALFVGTGGDVRVLDADASFEGLPSPPLSAVFEIESTSRVLRGDWELPDDVLLVFSPAWPRTTRALAEAIAATTNVTILRDEDAEPREVRQWWRSLSPAARTRVHLADVRVNSPWVRDYGPFQVRDRGGKQLWLDAEYDERRTRDDSMPSYLVSHRPRTVEDYPDWIEGGAFVSDGMGLCAATVDYFDLRGPRLADPEDVAQLQRALGCRVLAVFPALSTEPTNHADMVVQFLSPTRVLVASSNRDDEDARTLAETEAALQRAAASLGRTLEFVRVPVRYSSHGDFLSYVNGLRIAERFVMPAYGGGDALDREAAAAFAAGQPGVEVVSVDVKLAAASGGAVHCLTLGLASPSSR